MTPPIATDISRKIRVKDKATIIVVSLLRIEMPPKNSI